MPPTSPLLSLARIVPFLIVTLVLLPVQTLAVRTGWRAAALRIPLLYHGFVLRLFGVRIEQRGRPSAEAPTLFVSNHVSYLDIEVLGSLVPGSFVAKSEVANWPFFGWLAKAQRTVFIERRVGSMRNQLQSLAERLNDGGNLILFPEGTTGDGNHIRPFRSGLFSVAEQRPGGRPLVVQPVTIAYVALNGVPIGRDLRVAYAWYGDMELPGHFWSMLGLGQTRLMVEFHPPVTIDRAGSRKALAEHCQRVITESFAAANAGRLGPLPPMLDPAPAVAGRPLVGAA